MPIPSESFQTLDSRQKLALLFCHAGLFQREAASLVDYTREWVNALVNSPAGQEYLRELESGVRAVECVAAVRLGAALYRRLGQIIDEPNNRDLALSDIQDIKTAIENLLSAVRVQASLEYSQTFATESV